MDHAIDFELCERIHAKACEVIRTPNHPANMKVSQPTDNVRWDDIYNQTIIMSFCCMTGRILTDYEVAHLCALGLTVDQSRPFGALRAYKLPVSITANQVKAYKKSYYEPPPPPPVKPSKELKKKT